MLTLRGLGLAIYLLTFFNAILTGWLPFFTITSFLLYLGGLGGKNFVTFHVIRNTFVSIESYVANRTRYSFTLLYLWLASFRTIFPCPIMGATFFLHQLILGVEVGGEKFKIFVDMLTIYNSNFVVKPLLCYILY